MKSTPANNPPKRDAVADIIAYHDRTKHQPERYANGPGGLGVNNAIASMLVGERG